MLFIKKLILTLAILALHSATYTATLPVFLDSTPIDPDLLASLVDDDYNPDAFGLDLNEPLPGITPAAAASTHQSSQEGLSVAPAQQRGKRVVLPLAILARDHVTPETADRRRRRARVKPVNPVIAQTNDEHDDDDDPLTNKRLFKCEHCAYKTTIQAHLDRHLKIHKKDSITAECSTCSVHFSASFNCYLRHEKFHKGIWTFWQNGKKIPFASLLATRGYQKPHCPTCGQICNNMETHLKLHEKDVISLRCSECSDLCHFQSHGYERHATIFHPGKSVSWTFWQNNEELLPEDIALLLAPKKYTCPTCKQECVSKSNLEDHLKLHNKDVVSAKCSECSGIFSFYSHAYKSHATKSHSGKSPTWTFWQNNEEVFPEETASLLTCKAYHCISCKQICPSEKCLEDHLNLHNKDVVSAKCSECLYIFSIKNGVYKHHAINRHPGKSIAWTFWQNNQELSTENSILLFAATKYTCPSCKQEFKDKRGLDSHLKLHEENVVSAKCSECSGFFSIENSGYKQHAIKCHPGKSIAWTFWQNGEQIPSEK